MFDLLRGVYFRVALQQNEVGTNFFRTTKLLTKMLIKCLNMQLGTSDIAEYGSESTVASPEFSELIVPRRAPGR